MPSSASVLSEALLRRLDDGMDVAGLDEVIDAFSPDEDVADADIAALSRALAMSGSTLAPSSRATDVASTGGPASLTTLVCPLVQVADGHEVVKLAVPGRPAGGVDSLGSLPGYRASLSRDDVVAVVDHCGYAHFVADAHWAPADARLFARRQARGAQERPALVVASLLAKKLAVGIQAFALDVRVSRHGNFGGARGEAELNCARLVRVAALLGMDVVTVLSDGETPQQPAVGRGEALSALLELVSSPGKNEWLEEHFLECVRLARRPFGAVETPAPDRAVLASVLEANLVAQGSSITELTQRVAKLRDQPSHALRADRAGVPRWDLAQVRAALTREQALYASEGDGSFADPAGMWLEATSRSAVRAGEVIAYVRHQNEGALAGLAAKLQLAVSIEP